MRFEDVPPDALLYLVSYLRLNDIIHLLSTCSAFRKLSDTRSLWIDILQRIETEGCQSLACPLGEDFSQLNLSTLKKIAYHTISLDTNWSRTFPRIKGVVRVARCEEIEGPVTIFAVIPGTDLLLLCSDGIPRRLICYDLTTTTLQPGLDFGEISHYAQYDERGKHFIALVHSTLDRHFLDVICVEYGAGITSTMRRLYQMVAPRDCIAVFLHAEVVGVFYTSSSELSMLAVNFQTAVSVTIPLNLGPQFNPHIDTIFFSVLNHHVCLVTRSPSSVCEVYHGDRSALPFGDTRGKADGRFLSRFSITVQPAELSDELPSVRTVPCGGLSLAGLTTVYINYPSVYSIPTTTTIVLQPQVFTIFAQASFRTTLVGEVRSSQPAVFSAPSGNYMVLCVDSATEVDGGDVLTKLELVRVRENPSSIDSRPLEIPFFIDLNEIHSIALDDHMGVVILSHLRGYIFAVPFA